MVGEDRPDEGPARVDMLFFKAFKPIRNYTQPPIQQAKGDLLQE
jgi:hypothetical protein